MGTLTKFGYVDPIQSEIDKLGGQGGTNPFDQQLNTFDSVVFVDVKTDTIETDVITSKTLNGDILLEGNIHKDGVITVDVDLKTDLISGKNPVNPTTFINGVKIWDNTGVPTIEATLGIFSSSMRVGDANFKMQLSGNTATQTWGAGSTMSFDRSDNCFKMNIMGNPVPDIQLCDDGLFKVTQQHVTSSFGDAIHTSAKFQVDSTTKGFLQPRMTGTQRGNIGTPSTGLSVYDTTDNIPYFYNGTAWKQQSFTSGTHAAAFKYVGDGGTQTQNVNIPWQKLGSQVSLTIPYMQFNADTAVGTRLIAEETLVLPVNLRPSANVTFPYSVTNAGVFTTGFLEVASSGEMTFGTSLASDGSGVGFSGIISTHKLFAQGITYSIL
jgi:hypothetical protein